MRKVMFMALLWWDKEIVFKGSVLWLLHLVPYISFSNNPDSCHPGRLLPPLSPRSLPGRQEQRKTASAFRACPTQHSIDHLASSLSFLASVDIILIYLL